MHNGARNPFRFGAVVDRESFADREEELARLRDDLVGGTDVCLIAPRRYGKTSLALRAVAEAREAGAAVAYLDLFRCPTRERFVEELARALTDGLVAPFERIGTRVLRRFAELPVRPAVTVATDGTLSFTFQPGPPRGELDRTIEQLLAMPEEVARRRRRPVALVLDEFQEVVGIDPDLPRLMRSAFQLQDRTAHLYLGSRRSVMERVFTHENEPFFRSARLMALGPIPDEGFAAFIAERFRAGGREISPAALERVVGLTAGHPHNTQELCHFVWAALGPGDEATPATVEAALADLVEAEDARFTALVEGSSRMQRLLLDALAREPGQVYSRDYRARHRLPPNAQVQRAVGALADSDLIEPRAGAPGYRLSDPFLAAWLTRAPAG
jgi:uncharacterized protein